MERRLFDWVWLKVASGRWESVSNLLPSIATRVLNFLKIAGLSRNYRHVGPLDIGEGVRWRPGQSFQPSRWDWFCHVLIPALKRRSIFGWSRWDRGIWRGGVAAKEPKVPLLCSLGFI